MPSRPLPPPAPAIRLGLLARATRRGAVRAARGVPTGVWYMLGAALAFSAMNALVKGVSAELPTMEIVFVRTVVMGAATLVMLRGVTGPLLGVNRRLLFARGAVGATALSLLYFALGRIPLGDATTLHYTAPIWTALTAAVFLRERPGPFVIGGTAVSLLGVVLIAKPAFLFGDARVDLLAVGAALASSVLAGSVYTMVRKLRETDHPLVIVLYLAGVGALGSLPFALMGSWTWPTPRAWLLLLGVGVSTQIGQVCLTKGLHLLPAGRATAIGYVQIVFAFAWGLLFFGTAPDAWSLGGAALVLVATLLLIRRR